MVLVIFNFILHVNLYTTLWEFGLCLLDISVLIWAHANRTPYEFLWTLFPSTMCKKQPTLSSIFFSHKRQGRKKFSSKKLSFSHSNINYVVSWCWRNEIGRGNLILILFKLVSSKMKWRVRQGKWRRSPSSFRDKWEFCLQIFFFLTEGHSTSGTHLVEELLQPYLTPEKGVLVFFIRGHSQPQGCLVSSVSCTFDPWQWENVSLKYLGADKT